MKTVYILFFSAFFSIVLYNIIALQEDYPTKMKRIRKEKDEFFKGDDKSPMPDKNNFFGLKYFDANEKYKIKATIEYLEKKENFSIKTTKGENKIYQKIGYAVFNWDNKTQKILLLKVPNLPQLFIAFTDLTSNKTTYGGGRYIDINYQDNQKELELDFNMAYNPYCVYNEKYVCPIPPKENKLTIAIEAGEKLY